jgi:hypothetical protein
MVFFMLRYQGKIFPFYPVGREKLGFVYPLLEKTAKGKKHSGHLVLRALAAAGRNTDGATTTSGSTDDVRGRRSLNQPKPEGAA